MAETKTCVMVQHNMKKNKPGDKFEKLVECISMHLHEKAIITRNDKLKDVHTGKVRQLDLTIRVIDGPTKFLAIVEARDRSRKVGVDYIEQIKSKRDSVLADKAIIVSNKGFCQTALEKAKVYGIETYSLTEAMKQDWSKAFALFQGFTFSGYGGEYTITFLDDTFNTINVHRSFSDAVTKDRSSFVILDEWGKPKMSFSDLLKPLNQCKEITNLADSDVGQKHAVRVLVTAKPEDNLFFLDEVGELRRLLQYAITGNIWKIMKTCLPVLRQYKDEKTGRVHEEIIGADDPEFPFEILYNTGTEALSLRKK